MISTMRPMGALGDATQTTYRAGYRCGICHSPIRDQEILVDRMDLAGAPRPVIYRVEYPCRQCQTTHTLITPNRRGFRPRDYSASAQISILQVEMNHRRFALRAVLDFLAAIADPSSWARARDCQRAANHLRDHGLELLKSEPPLTEQRTWRPRHVRT